MGAVNSEALLFEPGHLIFHQSNQRADDQRRTAAGDARQLVAQ